MVKTPSVMAVYGKDISMPGLEMPDDAAEMLYNRIETFGMDHTGKFIHRDGQEIPW